MRSSEAHQRRRAKSGILVAIFCFGMATVFLVGCMTDGRLDREVITSRLESAKVWTVTGEDKGESGPLLLEGKLALADALRLALANNRELLAVRQEREVARGRVLESYGQALPHISANGGYTRLDEVSRIEVGPQSLSLGFEDNHSVELTVRQPIFHGAAIPSALRVARLYASWSDETIRATTEATIFQVTKAYYDWILARQLAAVDEQALAFARTLVNDVKRKKANGLASEYDVLRAEVELSNARAQSIQTRNACDMALMALLKLMGVSLNSRVEPADELSYKQEVISLEDALRSAMTNRAELLQAEYSVRMQKEAVKIASSAYWPKLDAFFSQKWAKPDPHSAMREEWGDAWTAGVGLNLPLFDGFERKGKLVQERARLIQSEIRLRSQEQAVALEVQQAILNLRNAEELVESQKMNLTRAEEGLRLVQAGYQQGVQNELAVLDARTALSRARALYYEALHSHMVARLAVERACGRLLSKTVLLPGPPSEKLPQVEGAPANVPLKDGVLHE
ncbi:MAG: TolC family protein [Kiritimatiellae bacterium]|nr:TolC family protein [Kiritimatiellia bacterium]